MLCHDSRKADNMRISTPVTKNTLRHHLDYHRWKYILLVMFTIFGWWLIYDVTEPQAPEHRRIDIYIQSETTADELMTSFMNDVWQSTVPDSVDEVNPRSILLSDEYNATMQLLVHLAAGDGDIYILHEDYFRQYAEEGAFVYLDELVADGTINAEGIDLAAGYVNCITGYDEKHNPNAWENKLCAIPLKGLYGFLTEMQVDNRELYACITVNNGNDDNVIPFFNAMLQKGRGEKPDWMAE